MKPRFTLLFTMLVIVSMLLAPAAPVAAQTEPPPDMTPALAPALAPIPEQPTLAFADLLAQNPAPFAVDDPALLAAGLTIQEGVYVMPGGAQEVSAQASVTGPLSSADAFGYRYQKVAPAWVDAASAGTKLAVSQVALPFPFTFYGHTYEEVGVSDFGAIFFNPTYAVPQGTLGKADLPNTMIAAYWSPLRYSAPDNPHENPGVYTLAGGAAPNRWIAVEWHNAVDPFNAGQFTFEAVLYESGEIRFQYQTMSYPQAFACGTAGIEDRTGLIATTTLKFCRKQNAGSAMRLVPPTSANLFFTPDSYSALTDAGKPAYHDISIENTGSLGSDIFNLALSSKWPAQVYRKYGAALFPLMDTDGDKKPDTGLVAEGEIIHLTVMVTPPAGAAVGKREQATLKVTSALNKRKSKSARLATAVAANFAQMIHTYSASDESKLLTFGPGSREEINVTRTPAWQYEGMIESAVGRTFTFGVANIPCVPGVCHITQAELRLAVYENDGSVVGADHSVVTLADPTYNVAITYPVAAQMLDGSVGFAWLQQNNGEQVGFAVVDANGDVITAPVTLNSLSAGNYYSNITIAPAGSDRFLISWMKSDAAMTLDFVMVDAASGAVLYGPETLGQNGVVGTTQEAYGMPSATRLANGNALLIWAKASLNFADPMTAHYTSFIEYAAISPAGETLKRGSVALGKGIPMVSLDSVQMSGGDVVVAWDYMAGSFPMGGTLKTYYMVLNGSTYKQTRGPTTINDNAGVGVSLAADANNHAVLTWIQCTTIHGMIFQCGSKLSYALVGSKGTLLTPGSAYRTSPVDYDTMIWRVDYQVTISGQASTSFTPKK